MWQCALSPAHSLLTPSLLDCDHINPSTCTVCNAAIEALIDAFTNSVSEYLTGESAQTDAPYIPPAKEQTNQKKGLERAGLKGFSKSHDNLSGKFTSYVDLSPQFSDSSKYMNILCSGIPYRG